MFTVLSTPKTASLLGRGVLFQGWQSWQAWQSLLVYKIGEGI